MIVHRLIVSYLITVQAVDSMTRPATSIMLLSACSFQHLLTDDGSKGTVGTTMAVRADRDGSNLRFQLHGDLGLYMIRTATSHPHLFPFSFLLFCKNTNYFEGKNNQIRLVMFAICLLSFSTFDCEKSLYVHLSLTRFLYTHIQHTHTHRLCQDSTK